METERAQPLQRALADAWRGRGEVPRWGFPCGSAGRVRPLRDHQCADPAGRAEILERRVAGSLFDARGRVAAARSRQAQAGLSLAAERIGSRNSFVSPIRRVTGKARARRASATALTS